MEFNQNNTSGYSDDQLMLLNNKWHEYVETHHLEPETDDYYQEFKWFSDRMDDILDET